ncbi:MAG: hypothetical protein H0S79_19210 [Anaerolineaceae bacterium]|nr:hypothetical protein [Anaerolineaceae bacterium]
MAYLLCPACGAHNPLEEEQCRICQASLVGLEPVEEPQPPDEGEEALDILAEEPDDLPDLLQGLKLEDIEYEIDPEGLPEINLDDNSELDDPNQTPEWLDAVRKRAQVEDDSVGDLIKRVEAAQESVAGEGAEKHNDFESWIQKLRDEARDEAAGNEILPEDPTVAGEEPEMPDSVPESVPEPEEADHSDWLTRIRKAHGVMAPEEGPNAASRSLLDWLVALEDNPPKDEAGGDGSDDTQEIETGWEKLPPEDITRQIKVVLEPRVTPQALSLTREESDQADLLSTIITDEKADHPAPKRIYKVGVQWINMLFLLVLVVGISLALFSGSTAGLARPQATDGAIALVEWADALPEGSDLLLIFDYQPAYASEMTSVAEPVLAGLADKTGEIYVASSVASGPLLADDILDDLGLAYTDVGYFPVASYGAYGVATGLTSGETVSGLPEPVRAMLDYDYDAILVLSDNFEGAQTWIEQLTARATETALGVLATSQAAPLLQPYFASGQIVGVVSGFSDAVALADLSGSDSDLPQRWQAYQVGVVILMVAMILGALFAPNKRSQKRPRGGK